MTPEQSRAGRGLLGWAQTELARNANVSRATVADFESRIRVPTKNNLNSMSAAMTAAGLAFLQPEETFGEGVRFRKVNLRYIKTIRVDFDRECAIIPMEYDENKFLCLVSREALEDASQKSISSEIDYANATTNLLPNILNVAESKAKLLGFKEEVLIKSEDLNNH